MKALFLVGIGSFIGGVLRYCISLFFHWRSITSFPFATLTVNLIGCFAIGVILAFSEKNLVSTNWKFFLVTGLCGGFTTFSAFSNETFLMIKGNVYGHAIVYVLASIVLGVAATVCGYFLAKLLA